MTKKDFKELKLYLLTVKLKQAADKRIKLPMKQNGMKNKGVIIHG